MSKITMATVKSFIRKNDGRLQIRVISRFDGMEDGVRNVESNGFTDALKSELHCNNNLGIQGAWFVGGSRDYLSPLSEVGYIGFHVYNCCGSFDIAVAP